MMPIDAKNVRGGPRRRVGRAFTESVAVEMLKATRPAPAWFEDKSLLPKRPPTKDHRP